MNPQDKNRDAGRSPGESSTHENSRPVESGPGALCAEAQADGVPCMEMGRDCETCRRAVQQDPLGS